MLNMAELDKRIVQLQTSLDEIRIVQLQAVIFGQFDIVADCAVAIHQTISVIDRLLIAKLRLIAERN